MKNTLETVSSISPLRSRATMVLSNVAGSGLFFMESISAVCNCMARSKAGMK
ncbi:MAG: hypothetical protein L6V35_04785 [Alistipes putredinis]|nr:MAG: hypothetical protein L6V35_04785 [Alistipes putredinis]